MGWDGPVGFTRLPRNKLDADAECRQKASLPERLASGKTLKQRNEPCVKPQYDGNEAKLKFCQSSTGAIPISDEPLSGQRSGYRPTGRVSIYNESREAMKKRHETIIIRQYTQ